ncbi:hypothetical protein H696_02406 [Fonticula alba]|uniref:C3H1-type domain-containing protein n=1 Tax=Fonticula alba TaxID=691883 RepID=A0A058ZAM1_FONAL|nr:hypothetical protein H696_02406 [Fonticula alba]KCV71460.1 hypothetical protein H696_02406 [Fonticula alba]|eukprot:XP_009494583.1 hypothetical protein H696_02406 [Fonticula alba]
MRPIWLTDALAPATSALPPGLEAEDFCDYIWDSAQSAVAAASPGADLAACAREAIVQAMETLSLDLALAETVSHDIVSRHFGPPEKSHPTNRPPSRPLATGPVEDFVVVHQKNPRQQKTSRHHKGISTAANGAVDSPPSSRRTNKRQQRFEVFDVGNTQSTHGAISLEQASHSTDSICRFYMSPTGCARGHHCFYLHLQPNTESVKLALNMPAVPLSNFMDPESKEISYDWLLNLSDDEYGEFDAGVFGGYFDPDDEHAPTGHLHADDDDDYDDDDDDYPDDLDDFDLEGGLHDDRQDEQRSHIGSHPTGTAGVDDGELLAAGAAKLTIQPEQLQCRESFPPLAAGGASSGAEQDPIDAQSFAALIQRIFDQRTLLRNSAQPMEPATGRSAYSSIAADSRHAQARRVAAGSRENMTSAAGQARVPGTISGGGARRTRLSADELVSLIRLRRHEDRIPPPPEETLRWRVTGKPLEEQYNKERRKAFDLFQAYRRQSASSSPAHRKAAQDLFYEASVAHWNAAASLFEQRNRDLMNTEIRVGSSPVVDLHGLHTNEVIFYLDTLIGRLQRLANRSGKPHYMHVITGTGNHSRNAVEEAHRRMGKVQLATMEYLHQRGRYFKDNSVDQRIGLLSIEVEPRGKGEAKSL